MMKKRWRQLAAIFMAAVMAVGTVMPAWAASRKKITSVSLTVNSDMKIGDHISMDQVELEIQARKGETGFRLDHCLTALEVSVEVQAQSTELDVTRQYGYVF